MPKSRTQITNTAIKWRGNIIARCSVLEKDIETFIADYFVSDGQKNYVFYTVLLDRFHFDGKIAVFESLIKQSCNTTTFKKTYSRIFSELRFIKDERNKFAHYVHFLRDEPSDNVTLLSFRDVVRIVDYSPEKYKDIIERINRSVKEVRKLNKNVHKFLPAQYEASSET